MADPVSNSCTTCACALHNLQLCCVLCRCSCFPAVQHCCMVWGTLARAYMPACALDRPACRVHNCLCTLCCLRNCPVTVQWLAVTAVAIQGGQTPSSMQSSTCKLPLNCTHPEASVWLYCAAYDARIITGCCLLSRSLLRHTVTMFSRKPCC